MGETHNNYYERQLKEFQDEHGDIQAYLSEQRKSSIKNLKELIQLDEDKIEEIKNRITSAERKLKLAKNLVNEQKSISKNTEMPNKPKSFLSRMFSRKSKGSKRKTEAEVEAEIFYPGLIKRLKDTLFCATI